MKFAITRTSENGLKNPTIHERAVRMGTHWEIEISSLEDLMSFITDLDEEVVIRRDSLYANLPHIEIYDDYRE